MGQLEAPGKGQKRKQNKK